MFLKVSGVCTRRVPLCRRGPHRDTGCRGSTYTLDSGERCTPGVCTQRAMVEHSAELRRASASLEQVLKIILMKSQTKKYCWVHLLFQAQGSHLAARLPHACLQGQLAVWPVLASPTHGWGHWAVSQTKTHCSLPHNKEQVPHFLGVQYFHI